MEIKEMKIEDIQERMSAISAEMEAEDADLNALESEIDALNERKAELKAEAEQRKAEAEAATESGEVVKEFKEEKTMEEKRFTKETPEYRDAFFATLVNKATAEQRAIFADNTTYGDGVALPVTTDKAIWDQILTAHPILNDIDIIKSGIVMKVTQMTPDLTTAGKGKKDSDTVVGLTFTSNEKILAGKDYTTYVEISYAEAKMSQGAMEAFLVKEVADALGEQLAKDVFASIVTDAAANSTTKAAGATYFETIGVALGKATQAANPVIYAPADLYYAILKEVDSNKQPIVREGVVLGAELKKDNAAAKITVVDPALYVLNVVADTQIKSQDDVKNAQFVIGGYLRAEGCLRKANAAAFIA